MAIGVLGLRDRAGVAVSDRASSESFAAVFNAHHRGALRLAYLLCGNHAVAEDAVSEAFAKVFPVWKRGGLRDPGAYLRRAVVNQINSRHRHRYVERREEERRTGDDRGARGFAEHAADRDEMWQALQRLPERQRQAIVLRYYEDMSEADAAAALGVSVGTVKSQVSRGLDKLRELIGDGPMGGER